jgi:hypothetical protein
MHGIIWQDSEPIVRIIAATVFIDRVGRRLFHELGEQRDRGFVSTWRDCRAASS